MRGVILAGGKGTRLGELTKVTNKHLLPVGGLPMVYYPLKKLVGVGIKDIMIVTGTEHMGAFVNLLGSGRDHGCSLTYRVQDEAGGIAQALGLAEQFVGDHRCCVVLGDNIFYDPIPSYAVGDSQRKALVFLKEVPDPSRYGVATVSNGDIVSIIEKPFRTESKLAVTGIYVYPPTVFSVIKDMKLSERGELEITDVNNYYLKVDRLAYITINGWWTDAGTYDSLDYANKMVRKQSPLF